MHSGLRSPFCAMHLRGSAVDSGSPLGEKRKAQHARTKVHSDKNHERLSQHEGSSTDDPSTCMLALTTHCDSASRLRGWSVWSRICPVRLHTGLSLSQRRQ